MNKIVLLSIITFVCAGINSAIAEEQYNFNFYNGIEDSPTSFSFPEITDTYCVEIGYFNSEWSDVKTFSELLSNWNGISYNNDNSLNESVNKFSLTYSFTINGIADNIVYAFVGNGANVSQSTAGALFSFKKNDNTSLTFSAFDTEMPMLESIVLDGNDEMLKTAELPTVNILKGTLNGNEISFIIIPEPSMFGLLAGLGALALVGSRRRRK